MKTASVDLDNHLQLETTTLATCWRATRRDNTQFHFTEHDRDLPVDLDGTGEQTYKSTSSYNRSAIKNDDTLAVDNLELTGVLTSGDVEELDLRRGLFDYARIEIFLVNWNDLAQGVLKMRSGRLGEVTITANGFFVAELRGLTQAYSRRIGELYSPECKADLGDARCKVPIQPEIAVRGKTYAVGDFVRAASELEVVPVSRFHTRLDGDATDLAEDATPTVGSQAQLQTLISKFGTGAAEFSPTGSVDPSNAFISYPDSASYTIGASEFTIECQVRFKDLTDTVQTIMAQSTNTADERSWKLRRNGANLEIFLSDDGTSVAPAATISGAFSFVIDTFYHVAVTRDASNDVRLFVDGTQVGVTTSFTDVVNNSTSPLFLGKERSAGFDDNPLFGFVDDARFVVGAALYTANFTAPTVQLPTIAETSATLLASNFDDRIYECTTGGTTDGTLQPTYNTTLAGTTTDGTAVFTAREAFSRAAEVTAVSGSEPRKIFTVTELTPNSGGSVPGRDHFPDDSMNGGVVVWETGTNAGVAMEIRDFIADDGVTITQDIELFLDINFDIVVGDRARVYRGCFKRVLGDCRDIFDNVDNFRGEPYVPGQDALLAYPDAKSG